MSSVHTRFEKEAADAVERIGPVHLRTLADRIAGGGPTIGIVNAVPLPDFPEVARRVLSVQLSMGMPDEEVAVYLRGVAAGYERHRATTTVESVWTGPATHAVPVRSTAQVLVDLVAEASYELILMTYSAAPYEPLLKALSEAVGRSVTVMVVVETLQGAGSALNGPEPAHAFTGVEGVQVWHWPVDVRTEQGAKMHAKLAVADQRVLLVSSANLTQSGVSRNLEAGLLVRGGTAPERAAQHVARLRARGVLRRLQ
ncbi:DISARM system phospholipase D-like protein DrmC [Microbispora sp. ATCC PTA-5024]|uniref:DISARM system phospholipase D-like protein DrmC n=1 Tax=Microbispora sp. ATCC PTA-5024 TaxID=316330 RepID=UPI000411E1B6|nr:DISARM system phospholipase D-like protein DrmC [Microbispora sp. ATCC PTA-5024]